MLDNFIKFKFCGIKNVFCLFQGKNSDTEKSLGSIAFNRGESNAQITENRKFLFESINMPVSELHQIHSNLLFFDCAPVKYNQTAEKEGDGLATDKPRHALLLKTADCQPVLFTHKTGKYIMALHVGWRANRNNFIQEAVESFCGHYQVFPKDLLAVRGPSLGPNQSEFVNFDAEWGQDYLQWFNPADKTLNLWELTKAQLEQAGLKKENIYGLDLCTKTMHGNYFSHRENSQTGRQASLIWFE